MVNVGKYTIHEWYGIHSSDASFASNSQDWFLKNCQTSDTKQLTTGFKTNIHFGEWCQIGSTVCVESTFLQSERMWPLTSGRRFTCNSPILPSTLHEKCYLLTDKTIPLSIWRRFFLVCFFNTDCWTMWMWSRELKTQALSNGKITTGANSPWSAWLGNATEKQKTEATSRKLIAKGTINLSSDPGPWLQDALATMVALNAPWMPCLFVNIW